MIIDNKATVIRDRKMQLMQPIILFMFIAVLLFSNIWGQPIYGVSRYHVILILCSIYLALILLSFIRNYNYFYFNNQNNSLTFRYYTLKPFSFNSQHKQIEFSRESFKKYEIKKQLFGLKIELIIYQKTGNKVAKYPPISLSALKKEEIENLVEALNAIK